MITIVKSRPGNKEKVGKYSFVNRAIKLWNQLPAGALTTFPCKSHIFRRRVRKVIICQEK